ncbi:hypothetical protein UFOVP45_36 [uncultured Caudovirales phage]|uniref:Uncharacterized protein n=1 Tax=uncultured Caudovirales phage TaxID=2100421 RepID=A0A6J5KN76_9CAUD|nr:hypothetical protein UFOVP45_36 [uncultured Caudovirales phage]
MKHFTNAIVKAAHDAASQMTADLRHSATEHGWHPDVVNNMRVNYHSGEFKVDIHPDVKDRAFVHEFGDESTRPSAVIRKYDSQTKNAEATLLRSLGSYMGGKL